MSNESNKKLKYQIGIDLEHQSAHGKRILDNYLKKANLALFTTLEYKLNEFIQLRSSGRIIYNTKYKAPFVPAINLLFDLDNYKIRCSYAKGFRDPDFKELFLDFVDINHNIVGNPLLLAEQSNNYQLNLSNQKGIYKTNISLFYNNISNKINLNNVLDTEQYSYFNIDEYKTKGISYSINISFNKIDINFGSSYTGRYNKLSQDYNTPTFNFALDYNLNAIFTLNNSTKLNVFYKNTGKTPNYIINNLRILFRPLSFNGYFY